MVGKSRVGRKLAAKFPEYAKKYLSRCKTTDGQTLGTSLESGRASEASQALTVDTIGSQLLDTFRKLETQDLTADKKLSKSEVEKRLTRLGKYIDSAKSDLSRIQSIIGTIPPGLTSGTEGGGGGDVVFVPGREERFGPCGEKITVIRRIFELDKKDADQLIASGKAVRAADNLRIAPSNSEATEAGTSAASSTRGQADVGSFVLDHWKKQMGRYLASTS